VALVGLQTSFSQWFGSFVQDVQIALVGENTIATLAGQFPGDTQTQVMLSGRPRARVARSSNRWRALERSRGGSGGTGCGMKARACSPPTLVVSYLPVIPQRIFLGSYSTIV
jgi:hypothetical protein